MLIKSPLSGPGSASFPMLAHIHFLCLSLNERRNRPQEVYPFPPAIQERSQESHQGSLPPETSPIGIGTVMEVARDRTNSQSGKTSQRRVDFNVLAWLNVCPLWGLDLNLGCVTLGNCATSSSLKSLTCKMEVMLMLVCRCRDTRQVST